MDCLAVRHSFFLVKKLVKEDYYYFFYDDISGSKNKLVSNYDIKHLNEL